MATMLSSPIGPSLSTGRYDLFDQPSSPTYKHDDLPAEFGDQSFGSSMSLGSSFELNRMVASGSSSSQLSIFAAQNRAHDDYATLRMPLRRSPPKSGQDSLGAAMGTVLNSRSPGLAAKMSSVDYMDMSSPPSRHINATPPKSRKGEEQYDLPPGSAMKEDTPVQQSHVSRRSASETTTTVGGSLGRLFGTELSINARHHSFQSGVVNESFTFQASPDKEPPLKRRPSSLPLTQVPAPVRPSLRSVGMAPPTSASSATSRRPNLLKSMMTIQSGDAKSSRRASVEPIHQQHRASDSMVPTAKSFSTMPVPRRSRSGSSDGSDLRDFAQLQRPSLPPLHPTIIESPSPSSLQNEDFGTYFFDPQSPQHIQSSQRNGSISSKLAPDCASRPRTFQKSATLAIVPSMLSVAGSGSSLGKRGNQYAKRPSLGILHPAPLSAHVYGAGASTSNAHSSARMTAPAPRRCQSAIDNSAAFAQAAEDLSMNSIDNGDSSEIMSPSDHRGKVNSTNRMFPPDFDASGSPIAPTARPKSRPGMLRKPSKDDSSPLGYGSLGKRLAAKQSDSCSPMQGSDESGSNSSPYRSAEGMPGFGASEREGKILPCFNIKNDGLMRIKPNTLIEVMSGIYNHQMDGFQIVDCRFGYEYEGGHIAGAINLSTVDAVIKHFIQSESVDQLPKRSQSGKPDANGIWKKKVLIFHCEFSAKRAPSMALALRQADRGLVHDYPNCHYPEVYILEGGYCGFFKQFEKVCEPRFYVQMDDPKFLDKRSKELNGFRKQFARHRSFTFGDNVSNPPRQLASEGTMINNPSFGRPINEESSFDNSSASPSAVQADVALARRKLTKGVSNSSRFDNTFKGIGNKPVLGSAPVTIGDLSLGCSSFGDSSFEGGPSDSPCAAAATNRRPSTVFLKAGKEATPTFNPTARRGSNSLARHNFQRAATAAHIHMR